MENNKKLKNFIKTTIREFLNEQQETNLNDSLSGTIIKRKQTGDWFWVVCGYTQKNSYGKDKPQYIVADVYKKNNKIYANIITPTPDEVIDVISKGEQINELPEKYKRAFDKLEDEYNLYPDGK